MKKIINMAIAIILSTLLSCIPLQNIYAVNNGGLTSSSKLQTYNSSIRDGLDRYVLLYGPTINAAGYGYSIGVTPDNDLEVVKFSPDRKFVKKFNLPSEYRIDMPTIGVDRNNNTYFAVTRNPDTHTSESIILKYNSNDQLVSTIDNFNDSPDTKLRGFYSFAVDSKGFIYTTAGSASVDGVVLAKLSQDGDILSSVTSLTGNAKGNTQPLLVALNAQDQLYVSAMQVNGNETARIFKVSASGNIISEIGDGAAVSLGYSMNIDSNNNLYFMSFGDYEEESPDGCPMTYTIRKYDSTGTFIGSIDTSAEASEGPVCSIYGGGATPAFSSQIGVGVDGDIYIGTGDYQTGAVGQARIAIYSMTKNIATFPPQSSGQQTTTKLQLTSGADLLTATLKTQQELGAPHHEGYSYPLGIVSFSAKANTTDPVTVSLTFFTDLTKSDVIPMKYQKNKYTPIAGATITETTIDGKHALVLSYSVADGGELDEDGVVNGVIVDPVGLAVLSNENTPGVTTPLTPNTGAPRQSSYTPIIIATLFVSAGLFLLARKSRKR